MQKEIKNILDQFRTGQINYSLATLKLSELDLTPADAMVLLSI